MKITKQWILIAKHNLLHFNKPNALIILSFLRAQFNGEFNLYIEVKFKNMALEEMISILNCITYSCVSSTMELHASSVLKLYHNHDKGFEFDETKIIDSKGGTRKFFLEGPCVNKGFCEIMGGARGTPAPWFH